MYESIHEEPYWGGTIPQTINGCSFMFGFRNTGSNKDNKKQVFDLVFCINLSRKYLHVSINTICGKLNHAVHIVSLRMELATKKYYLLF